MVIRCGLVMLFILVYVRDMDDSCVFNGCDFGFFVVCVFDVSGVMF